MEQRCEVCENFRPQGDVAADRKLQDVRFAERNVRLCVGHALIAKNSGVSTLEELRELYRESEGKRSFVQRRSAFAPPRSTAHRRNVGRRATDA